MRRSNLIRLLRLSCQEWRWLFAAIILLPATALSIKTAGVCAIVADRERGILWGGADPRRAARAMGW